MHLLVIVSLMCTHLAAGGEQKFEEVTKLIENYVTSVRLGIASTTKEVEDALTEYRSKKEHEATVGHTDYNVLQMYEWYEKEGNKATKKCLSHQRNLQMIRAGYKENLLKCFVRADGCVTQIKEQLSALVKTAEKHASIVDLTGPCADLDVQDECLSQAVELAQQRTQSIMALMQRFDIFKKLKLYEIETNYSVCTSISDTYKESEANEIHTLQKCMQGGE